MEYNGTIYRPPVEANTCLLPITEGCSHNSYKEKFNKAWFNRHYNRITPLTWPDTECGIQAFFMEILKSP